MTRSEKIVMCKAFFRSMLEISDEEKFYRDLTQFTAQLTSSMFALGLLLGVVLGGITVLISR